MGIRASGEDGLIDRERREGSRNQGRPWGGQEVAVTSALCVLREEELYSHSYSHSHSLRDPEGCVQLVLTLGEEVTGVTGQGLGSRLCRWELQGSSQ